MERGTIHISLLMPYKIKGISQLLSNAFINFQFLYTSLIWMFASKISINKICKIHFRTFQIGDHAHDKLYEELLPDSNDISVHQKALHILVKEVNKSLMETNLGFMWDFYTIKPLPYDLRPS